jgi:hypothetical protein
VAGTECQFFAEVHISIIGLPARTERGGKCSSTQFLSSPRQATT